MTDINDLSQHTAKYVSNLNWMPDHLGLKTVDDDTVVVTANGGVHLVCAACDAPFTVEQWQHRQWLDNGDLLHEGCEIDV